MAKLKMVQDAIEDIINKGTRAGSMRGSLPAFDKFVSGQDRTGGISRLSPYFENYADEGYQGEPMSVSSPSFDVGDYAPIDSFQSGTPYVPKTGLYELHQGEKVIPPNGSRQKSLNNTLAGGGGGGGNVVINLGGVSINAGGVTDAAGMVKQLDLAIAQEIKYGRSEILRELQAVQVLQ
jgi:hypothetical protein